MLKDIFYVTTSEDCVPDSLRYKIDEANRSSKPIIIEINEQICSDIILLTSEIKISSNVRIINSTGHDLTISIKSKERLFHILPSSTKTIFESSEHKFILTGGNPCSNGGAILIDSPDHTLILDGVTINNNKAIKGGAVYTSGKVILNSSIITFNEALIQGGAIWSEKDVNLINSQISHNFVTTPAVKSCGGGILVDNGSCILTKSSVSHNRVFHTEKIGGSGAGIVVMTGDLYVQNHSHVDDNQSFNSPGVQVGKGNIYLSNGSTASRNKSFNPVQGSGGGGAITINFGDVFIYRSDIIDNTSVGMFSAGIVSLVGNVSIEHSRILRNVNKGPGGGCAVNFGSVSIHASIISQNTASSLGGGLVIFTPNSSTYINSTKIANNILTNSETILQTIEAFISVITQNFDATNQQAQESGGSGSISLITILPDILSKIISNFTNIKEKSKNLLTSPHIAGGGIASLLSTKITLINSDIEGNTFQNTSEANSPFISLGGGIFNYKGPISLDKTTVKNNTGATTGGGIYSGISLLTTNATISENSADNGGGIFNGGTSTILSSSITGNTAKINGGGILSEGDVTLISSSVTLNNAKNGGGIYTSGNLIVFDTEIDQNTPNDVVKA
jgi:predicted outer membrane repeat protein